MTTEPFPKMFNEGLLKVSSKHSIWFAECGNPDGVPVVTLHGGPGSRSKAKYMNVFNTETQRIITFDQRGCGNSTPQGGIEDNTTQDLISDMEKLREHLKIKRWMVNGGSWGSTLALAYSEAFPKVVASIFLRATFLGRSEDLAWLFSAEGGAAKMFPDLWEKRMEFLNKYKIKPETASKQMLKLLTDGDRSTQAEVAAELANWEDNLITVETNFKFPPAEEITDEEINAAKIFLHYDANDFFLKKNQLLDNIDKLKNIPVSIIHGRYDVICPLEQSYLVHKALPLSKLEITNFDGHKLTAQGERFSHYLMNELVSKF